jgi:hypothetical protein
VNVLKDVVNCIESNNHTDIIFVGWATWFELLKSSCVREKMCTFIGKLEKLIKHSKCVSLVNINGNPESFPQHRLHLNNSGKDTIFKE